MMAAEIIRMMLAANIIMMVRHTEFQLSQLCSHEPWDMPVWKSARYLLLEYTLVVSVM